MMKRVLFWFWQAAILIGLLNAPVLVLLGGLNTSYEPYIITGTLGIGIALLAFLLLLQYRQTVRILRETVAEQTKFLASKDLLIQVLQQQQGHSDF